MTDPNKVCAVWAKLEVVATEEDMATLAVPNRLPVMLPVTVSDPVTSNPLGKLTNPEMDCAKEEVTA